MPLKVNSVTFDADQSLLIIDFHETPTDVRRIAMSLLQRASESGQSWQGTDDETVKNEVTRAKAALDAAAEIIEE